MDRSIQEIIKDMKNPQIRSRYWELKALSRQRSLIDSELEEMKLLEKRIKENLIFGLED